MRINSNLAVTFAASLLAFACSTNKTTAEETKEQLSDSCPGKPWIDECAALTPRVEVTVKDQDGAPVANALVGLIGGPFDRKFIDANAYPEKDSADRKFAYHTCTNEEGKASFCGFEAAKLDAGPGQFSDMPVMKSGYTRGTSGNVVVKKDDGVITKEITIAKTQVSNEKLLVMVCEQLYREAVFNLENVGYTVAPYGKAIDTLVPDPTNPLRDFDTLYIGSACSAREQFWELLIPEKNKLLLDWVAAGGLLVLGPSDSALWSSNTADDNVASGCKSPTCPREVFPAEYRFEMATKAKGGCHYVPSATIVDPAHPLMNNLASTVAGHSNQIYDWKFHEETFIAPKEAKDLIHRVGIYTVLASSVNTSVWHVLLTGIAAKDDYVLNSPSCVDIAPFNQPNSLVLAMEASLGQGKIVVEQTAYLPGSLGDLVGVSSDAGATQARHNMVEYIRAWKK